MSRAETTWKTGLVGIAFCVWAYSTPSQVIAQTQTLADAPPPPKVAAMLNLHVQNTLVHLFCDSNTACEATFYCKGGINEGGISDDPVEWKESLNPNTLLKYYRNRIVSGNPAGFGDIWRRETGSASRNSRTTCIVRSNDPVEARAYTQWGVPEWIPASNRIHPPEPYPSARLSGLTVSAGTLSPAFASSTGTYTLTTTGVTEENFTLTPTAEESRAEIRVDGKVVQSGEPTSKEYDVTEDTHRVTIAVTSYDGQVLSYYVNYN